MNSILFTDGVMIFIAESNSLMNNVMRRSQPTKVDGLMRTHTGTRLSVCPFNSVVGIHNYISLLKSRTNPSHIL